MRLIFYHWGVVHLHPLHLATPTIAQCFAEKGKITRMTAEMRKKKVHSLHMLARYL